MKSLLIADTTREEREQKFNARYISGAEGPDKSGCGFSSF